MDFNYQYPSPRGYYCNYEKQNAMNDKIFKRNEQLHCKYQNQLDLRPESSRCCRYNENRKDKFPSSCNYEVPPTQQNVGHMKCYSQNIDHESRLIHSEISRGVCKPACEIEKCLEDCALNPSKDDSQFPTQYKHFWNNPTKRKHLN